MNYKYIINIITKGLYYSRVLLQKFLSRKRLSIFCGDSLWDLNINLCKGFKLQFVYEDFSQENRLNIWIWRIFDGVPLWDVDGDGLVVLGAGGGRAGAKEGRVREAEANLEKKYLIIQYVHI